MSHNITNKDGLAFTGEKPWHGIGVEVGSLMTASESLMHANLSWEVRANPIYKGNGDEIDGFKAITRQDTGEVFKVVTNRYTPIQNVDCFKIFDEVTGTGQAKYEVVGSLQGGRKVWLLARIPSLDFAVKGSDEVRSYMLLTTSHDGTLALQMLNTPIRVVCNNTLTAALSRKDNSKAVHLKHTTNYQSKIDFAKTVLAESIEYFTKFKNASEHLASQQMRQLDIDNFLMELFNIENLDNNAVPTRTKNAMNEVSRLFVDGIGHDQQGIRGSKWAMYNAVTQYIDHERTTKGDESNRLASSWYGSGSQLREKAFAVLVR